MHERGFVMTDGNIVRSETTPSSTDTLSTKDRESRGSGRYIVGLALSAGLAGLLYGYDTVSISGAIDYLTERYSLDPGMEGLIISSIMIGGVVGAGFSGFLSDRFGRRSILMWGASFFFVAALWSSMTFSPYDLIAARIFGGVGIGLAAALAVTYITESAPPSIRGALSSAYQLLTVCGIFLTNIINYIIASSGSHEWGVAVGWRWMLGIGAIPALIFFVALWFSPESPRFLVQSGREEEGYEVLVRINGTHEAKESLAAIKESIAVENKHDTSLRNLFEPGLRRALFIGIFLAIFNQAVGMNVISYYGPVIFKSIGFGGNTQFLAASCVGGVNLVFTVVGMYLIDTAGRKSLMIIGSALMMVFSLCISWSFFNNQPLLLLVSVMLFVSAFAISMGPIPWIMIPELFPTYLRGRATGICTVFLWATNWAIGQFTPIMINGMGGGGTFIVFAVANLVCLLGVITIVPETKDRTLEEIELYWRPKTPLNEAKLEISDANADIRGTEAKLQRLEAEREKLLANKREAERHREEAERKAKQLKPQH